MSVHSQKIVMHRFDASGYYDSNRQPMNTKQNKGLSMGWTLIAIVKKGVTIGAHKHRIRTRQWNNREQVVLPGLINHREVIFTRNVNRVIEKDG